MGKLAKHGIFYHSYVKLPEGRFMRKDTPEVGEAGLFIASRHTNQFSQVSRMQSSAANRVIKVAVKFRIILGHNSILYTSSFPGVEKQLQESTLK